MVRLRTDAGNAGRAGVRTSEISSNFENRATRKPRLLSSSASIGSGTTRLPVEASTDFWKARLLKCFAAESD